MTELLIGDPAPGLMLGEFLMGEPIAELIAGNVYVIEFWASWCGPCRRSMSHLSELQNELPQITVIGVSIERDTAAARTFLAEMGDQIRYRIAMDQRLPDCAGETEGWMTRHWLHAIYKTGVPAAFIVDANRKIAWVGHPIELKATLARVNDGTWDLEAAAHAHKETINKDRVRFHFQAKIFKALGENDNATAVAEIDRAIAAEPSLEEVFWGLKLRALMKDRNLRPAAKSYAIHFIDIWYEHMRPLLSLSTVLFQPNKMQAEGQDFEQETEFLNLALQTLHRIDELLGRQPQPDTLSPTELMYFDSHFARALLTAGKIDEARDRALRALRWGNECDAPDKEIRKWLDEEIIKLQELVSECRRRLSQ